MALTPDQVIYVVILSSVVGVLWKLHLNADARERKRADDAEARLERWLTAVERGKRRQPPTP